MQISLFGCSYLKSSALACFKVDQGSRPGDRPSLLHVNAGMPGKKVSPSLAFLGLVNGVSYSGIRVSTVPMFSDYSGIANAHLWLLPMFYRISYRV